MWSDNETSIDYLNYVEVSEIICDMVTDSTLLPLSVGVYGGWGAGKSSVLQLVRRALESRNDTIVIEFDAWLYQGFDEAKSAMMTVIASELLAAAPVSIKDKARDLFGRANKLRFLGIGAEVGLAAAGVPTFGLLTRALGSVQDAWNGEADESDAEAIKDGAGEVAKKAGGLFSKKEIKTPPEEIAAFKEEFAAVLNGMGKRLVVFVDNLDRCLPENAIRGLEAMRLFLSMDKTAFVIAADVDIIRHAVSTHFKGASQRHVIDYLDKLIQFPVTVPKLGMREVLSFLCMLIATRSGADANQIENLRGFLIKSIQTSWQSEEELKRDDVLAILGNDANLASQIDTAFRIAPILAYSKAVSGNPRLIKRMMNVVRMRHATAVRRAMNLDEAIITKLALFERCTDEATFRALLDLINAAPGGRSPIFDAARREEVPMPESLVAHKPFVEEWLELEPTLKNVDLRPAIYLARETLPLQLKSKSLSPNARQAVSELLKAATLSSRAARTSIGKIPADEILDVMQELVGHLRQNGDWDNKRNDLNGAIILAQEKTESAAVLEAFLKTVQNPKPWFREMVKALNE